MGHFYIQKSPSQLVFSPDFLPSAPWPCEACNWATRGDFSDTFELGYVCNVPHLQIEARLIWHDLTSQGYGYYCVFFSIDLCRFISIFLRLPDNFSLDLGALRGGSFQMCNASGANIARQESSWWPCARRWGLTWKDGEEPKLTISI